VELENSHLVSTVGGPALSIIRPGDYDLHVIALSGIVHRGAFITKKLTARRNMRRARRSRKTRYGAARFANRCRLAGWLAPGLIRSGQVSGSCSIQLLNWQQT
jgi:hypothetical protein